MLWRPAEDSIDHESYVSATILFYHNLRGCDKGYNYKVCGYGFSTCKRFQNIHKNKKYSE